MAGEGVRVGREPLKDFARQLFMKIGMPPQDAETEADVLVWANLRGIDSHGVLRIPTYVKEAEGGYMNVNPRIQTLKETPAILVIEADRAFGPVATTFAMQKAMGKAKKTGIGWVFIRNITHQGAMGYYSLLAAEKDMVGLAEVSSPLNMAPYGSRAAGVANNPIAIAVPAKRHSPLVLDMATSIIAGGKLLLAIDKGVSIPTGWALDKDGNPTTDPKAAEILLPVGGPKGSGLALMLECITSVLLGNPMLEPYVYDRRVYDGHEIQNSFVAAIDIRTFTNVKTYKEHIDNLIDGIKALPKAEGFAEIFVPGEPEARTAEERARNGIPLPEGTVRNLRNVAGQLGVKLPQGL